jgi:hypothetical protein
MFQSRDSGNKRVKNPEFDIQAQCLHSTEHLQEIGVELSNENIFFVTGRLCSDVIDFMPITRKR